MREFLTELEESTVRYSERKNKKVNMKVIGTADDMTVTINVTKKK